MKRILLAIICCNTFAFVQAQEHWDSVGGGVGKVGPDGVYALFNDTIDNVLYAGGSFIVASDTISCNGFAIWDSTKWSTLFPYLGSGTPNISAFAFYRGKIYGCSAVGTVFLIDSSKIKVIGDFDGQVKCLAVFNDKLYAGGEFTEVNGINARRISCYNGISWDTLAGGLYWSQACCSSVSALCTWNNKLIVGGIFDRAINDTGEVVVGSIASWNDSSWNALGSGMVYKTTGTPTGWVYSISVYKNDLYAGGYFDSAGGEFSKGIARWDGIKWYPLGKGLGNYAEIHCMTVKDSNLFIGGLFSGAVDVPNTSSIAKWDGANLHSVGNLLEKGGELLSLAVYKNQLYIAGYFGGITSGIYYKNIARLLPDSIYDNTIDKGKMSVGKLNIYPNPVTDNLEVISSISVTEIELKDLLGRTVYQQAITSRLLKQTENINIRALAPGIYFAVLKNEDGGVVVRKVVKE